MTFKEYAKKHRLDQDNYPKSKAGVFITKTMLMIILFTISSLAAGFIFKFIGNHLNPQPPQKAASTLSDESTFSIVGFFGSLFGISKDGKIGSFFANNPYLSVNDYDGFLIDMCHNGFLSLAQFLTVTIQKISIILLITLFICHVINAIMRQRSYERNVISNDWQAEFLRRRVLGMLGVKAKKTDAKRRLNKSSGGGKNSSASQSTYEERMKLRSYQSLSKMKVYVNTRQSVDGGDGVIKQYRVRFDLPSEEAATALLEKELEGVQNAITKACRGTIKFGKPFLSDDRQYLVTRGILLSKDKYQANVKDKAAEISNDSYQSIYPVSLLKDHREELEAAKEASESWTIGMGKQLNAFLATNKTQATQSDIDVGATNVLFTFDLSEDTQIPSSFQDMEKALDSMTGRVGSVVKLDANKLLIMVPLPEQYKAPIDIPTLYLEAFGGQ